MMRSLIIATGLIVGGMFASGAQAVPLAGMAPVEIQQSRDVVKVDYPCGRGWHLGRSGYCRPNRPPPPPRRWHRPPPPPPGWYYGGPPRPYWDGPPPPPPPRYYRY